MMVKGEKGRTQNQPTSHQDLHRCSLHSTAPGLSFPLTHRSSAPWGGSSKFSGTGGGLGQMPVWSQWLLPEWKAWCRPVFGTVKWTLDSALCGGLSQDSAQTCSRVLKSILIFICSYFMKGQLYFDLREIMTFPFTRVWICKQSSWLPLGWWLWLFTQYISDAVKVKRESDRTLSSGGAGRPLLTLHLGADCHLQHTCGSPAFLGLGFVFLFFSYWP